MNYVQGAILHAYDGRRPEAVPATGGARLEMASSAAPGIHLAVYDNLGAVEQAWRRFEPGTDCTVFQSFDHLATWQKHIGARRNIVPAIVIARRGNGEILFLLPLAVDADGLVRRLRWLGHDLSDYLAPLLAADFSRSIRSQRFVMLWREICDLLLGDPRFAHDLIELRKMPKTVGAQSNPFLHLDVALHPSGAHATKLQDDWNTFYTTTRSSRARRQDRSKRKRLGEHGKIQMVVPTDEGEIARTVETIFRQKARNFARMGIADIFARPGYREFYLDLATNARTRKFVHVSRIEVGSAWVATGINLVYRDRCYYVLVGYNGKFSRYSPGALHLHELMHHATDLGIQYFDFTIGDERFKNEWSNTSLRLYDYVAAATPRGWPVAIFSRGFTRLKRTIKQTPILWRGFCRLRAAIGSRWYAAAER